MESDSSVNDSLSDYRLDGTSFPPPRGNRLSPWSQATNGKTMSLTSLTPSSMSLLQVLVER